jgi:hypothetical protein
MTKCRLDLEMAGLKLALSDIVLISEDYHKYIICKIKN